MFDKFLKDPFFHFMFVGIILYMLQLFWQPKQEIKEAYTPSTQEVDMVKITWQEAWNRPISSEELKSVLRKKEQDERLFEEAIAMGLHKEDTFIYERLVSKTKHLLSDIHYDKKSEEKELKHYYESHHDNYRKDGLFSFSHLFISIHHDKPIQKAKEMLILLQETGVKVKDIDKYGDSFDLPHLENASQDEIVKLFGESFYKQLNQVQKSRWSEPIISTLGVHLVFISAYKEGNLIAFESIKDVVESDFIEEKKQKRYAKRLKSMMDR